MYRVLIHIGMAENSTDTNIFRGVYSWGTLHRELDETLSFDYEISTHVVQSASVDIGFIYPVGTELLISWKSDGAYGVDKISPSGALCTSGYAEFLITDIDKVWAEKEAHVLRGYFKELASGDGVKLKYKIDRDAWVEGVTKAQLGYATTALDKEARLPFPTKANRFNEFQFGVTLETTNSTSPEFYGIAIDIDDLKRERRT